jgi:hypothetical protein
MNTVENTRPDASMNRRVIEPKRQELRPRDVSKLPSGDPGDFFRQPKVISHTR